jgi:hypothetical protein
VCALLAKQQMSMDALLAFDLIVESPLAGVPFFVFFFLDVCVSCVQLHVRQTHIENFYVCKSYVHFVYIVCTSPRFLSLRQIYVSVIFCTQALPLNPHSPPRSPLAAAATTTTPPPSQRDR